MSGIFLSFAPAGLPAGTSSAFHARLRSRTTRVPDDRVETVETAHLVGAAIHHGFLRSGGVAENAGGSLLVSGSCWLDATESALSAPAEILARCSAATPNLLPPFGGVYSLAHFDAPASRLMVESDRFGAMPIYYREDEAGIRVATEIKFLVEPGRDKISDEALGEMMSLGYLSRPHTLVSGIRRLPGHSRLIYDPHGTRIVPLPAPGYPRNRPVDDDVITQYDDMVQRFLQRFRGAAPSYSLSLSGGLDSRLLAAAALREGFDLGAFTTGEKGSLETRVARQVAEQMGIPVHVHNVDGESLPRWFTRTVWFTEGRVMPGHMHYMTANFQQEVPAGPQLHGLAGETVLGGHFDVPSLEQASPEAIRKACTDSAQGLNYWPHGSQALLFPDPVRQAISASRPAYLAEMFDRIGFTGTYSDYLNFRYRFRMEGFSNPCLMSQVLPWTDVVCPFLDSDAFDFGASLELAGIAERGGQLKWGLKYFPEIAKLPRIKAGVEIPIRDDDPGAYARGAKRLLWEIKAKYYLTRLSHGRINMPILKSFPFYGQWYRRWQAVREYVDGILLSEQALDRGIYRREGMKKLLYDCRIGRNTWAAIGTILVTEIFLRQFIDGTDIPEDAVTPWGLDP